MPWKTLVFFFFHSSLLYCRNCCLRTIDAHKRLIQMQVATSGNKLRYIYCNIIVTISLPSFLTIQCSSSSCGQGTHTNIVCVANEWRQSRYFNTGSHVLCSHVKLRATHYYIDPVLERYRFKNAKVELLPNVSNKQTIMMFITNKEGHLKFGSPFEIHWLTFF